MHYHYLVPNAHSIRPMNRTLCSSYCTNVAFLSILPTMVWGVALASSDSSVESISRDEWLWENQQLFPIKTLVLFIALRTTKLLWCYATHPLCHYSPHFEKVIFRHESFNYQAMTEAAIFTIGYGKIWPLHCWIIKNIIVHLFYL